MDNNTNSNPPPGNGAPAPTPGHAPHNDTAMAILCYLGILVLIPLLTEAKKDPFVNFHIRQGLVLLIAWVLGSFLFWVPVFGWLLWAFTVIMIIIGIMNVTSGQQKELPLIGHLGRSFHI
jgi:uncharacterized membrane protein